MEEMKPNDLNIEQLMLAIVNISMKIEAIEHLLKEKKKIPYDLEGISVSTSDENTRKTMGDLHRERAKMQQQLQERLIIHKMKPYIGIDHDDFICKVAAAILENTGVLEDSLRTEFEAEIDNMIKRYKELNVFFVKQKPRNLVINRLKEALQCYVHGYSQGCAILCRSTLEAALREKLKEKVGQETDKRKTLGPLLEDAIKFGIITSEDGEIANKIKPIGDETVHESRRCSATEAFESLSNTKLLLNTLYR